VRASAVTVRRDFKREVPMIRTLTASETETDLDDTSARLADVIAQRLSLFLMASLFGIVVFFCEILVFILFPFGALGYGAYRLVRLLKNWLLK
jgi:hypothetical protein